MIESDVLEHVLGRIAHCKLGREVFGAAELARWPHGIRSLIDENLLERTTPAQVIECDGCERNCLKPVVLRPSAHDGSTWAFIACNEPEDMGRIRIKASKLEQWQLTDSTLAYAVTRLLGFQSPPREGTGRRWILGTFERETIALSIEGTVALECANRRLPLIDLLTLQDDRLHLNSDSLVQLIHSNSLEKTSDVGSMSWRKNAQAAANARHDKPGGSRDKRRRILEVWATGKYSSRDRCAEEEAGALGMAISTARKALINAPEPKRRG